MRPYEHEAERGIFLAITVGVPHHLQMSGANDASDTIERLGREAQPLRAALTRYFRRRIRDQTEVEDLVQDVFARIVRRDNAKPIEHLGSYVYQTAASVLADRSRRRAVRLEDAQVPFDPDVHGDVDIDPERIVSGREDLRTATAALLSLPERTRTIFVLRRLEGARARDVAAQLGISVSSVEKHMMRAVRHLSARLGGFDAS